MIYLSDGISICFAHVPLFSSGKVYYAESLYKNLKKKTKITI